mmetsp:Transcript_10248/g.62645  ORF Transcript_10248/g.62645 Transcript_10248/m.62645 type:complete len:281 (+) Transcript_10248:1513-2355(+)
MHELDGLIHAMGHFEVAFPLLALAHEVEVPEGDPLHAGVAAAGEASKQVQGGGALVVGLDKQVWIGDASLCGELRAVDDVAAIGRQLDVSDLFHGCGARLRELSSHASELDDGHATREGEHDGHLEQHAEGVSDVVGAEIVEAFRAVSSLEHERFSYGCFGQLSLERPCFSCEDQRWDLAHLVEHTSHGGFVGIFWLLQCGFVPPAVWRPGLEVLAVFFEGKCRWFGHAPYLWCTLWLGFSNLSSCGSVGSQCGSAQGASVPSRHACRVCTHGARGRRTV